MTDTTPQPDLQPIHPDTLEPEVAQAVADPPPTPAENGGRPAREALDRALRLIRDAVLRMGSLVEDAVRSAARALTTHDAQLAAQVIRDDAIINEVQRGMTRLIAVTIATQQPVARDLRQLLTLDHVGYELERMGDHASSVAKQVLKLAGEPPLEGYVHLPAMAERDAEIVHAVLRALVELDEGAARAAAGLDDEIDRLYHETFDRAVALMQRDPANVDQGARIILASHYLERIGDRATNVAEDIVFLNTGEVE
ncbi:MAG TPA: phosphate signaling complex protein PhoU, partial [Candidatus Dormibacteraeota bacterium]|nr:phosphate signaling complex protein PhoU [Candidatus Dormibacteraeota bacterium]